MFGAFLRNKRLSFALSNRMRSMDKCGMILVTTGDYERGTEASLSQHRFSSKYRFPHNTED